ncbi:MAG: toll/interleukin-1 receptor domain-containing protein [Acidobacteria bacterium]|nr:toll/interleukin-1 receptor domain-containing protein [Acidobacteriota bacterium]
MESEDQAESTGEGQASRVDAGVVISYRREDTRGDAGRLYEQLAHTFGKKRIFMDIDSIPAGKDFRDVLEGTISRTSVLLVLIGDRWAAATDSWGRRRLDNDEDIVRLEIATAIRQGTQLIPVLVGSAKMPSKKELPDELKELATRQAISLSEHHFRTDVRRCCTIQPRRELGRLPNPSFTTPRRRTSACRDRPCG